MSQISLQSGDLSARIHLKGAELNSLALNGDELIWQADPDVWPRHAPILFPIVGRLEHDLLNHNGEGYPLTQHGFARDLVFDCLETSDTHCLLELRANEATLKRYPFEFALQVEYRLSDSGLATVYRVINPSAKESLPCSIGGHPAFVWPLPGNSDKGGHCVSFTEPEPAPIRRLLGGLLMAMRYSTPVDENCLMLDDALFEMDAIIFDQLNSRELLYSGPQGPKIRMSFKDFPHLGIWTKPGAGFICLEPWQGHASPISINNEFTDKPGLVTIAPQSQREWQFGIQIEG